jgi:hypothetical protein
VEGRLVEEDVLYRRTFCIGGRFVEGRCVEGCLVEGRFVGRTFCSEGRFVEGLLVLAPLIVRYIVYPVSVTVHMLYICTYFIMNLRIFKLPGYSFTVKRTL